MVGAFSMEGIGPNAQPVYGMHTEFSALPIGHHDTNSSFIILLFCSYLVLQVAHSLGEVTPVFSILLSIILM